MKNLLFLSYNNNFHFLNDLFPYFDNRFNIKKADYFNEDSFKEFYEWADIVWLEWADKNAISISNLPKSKYLILRLHSYEYFSGKWLKINWKNIDRLILVGENIKQYLLKHSKKLFDKTKITIINNYVDTDKFPLKQSKKNKDLAFVGSLRHCKNIPFLLQCFKRILMDDDSYTLHVAGNYQTNPNPMIVMETTELKHYIDHIVKELGISKSIFFYGDIIDINGWMEDKTYIISSSTREGMPVNILEGMSKGLMPIVHNFPGSKLFYPKEFVYNTVEEFRSILFEEDVYPKIYRSFIQKEYSLSKTIQRIDMLFSDIS